MAERPTPYSIALCALVNLERGQEGDNYYFPNSNLEKKSFSSLLERLLHSRPSSLDAIPEGLGACICPSFSTLLQLIDSAGCNRGISQALCQNLASIGASVDDLVNFFEYLISNIAIASTATNKAIKSLDWTSKQGLFIRKQTLGYQSLDFESVARLWVALCRYIDTTLSDSESDYMENMDVLWPPSVDQMEIYVQDKCVSLEFTTTPQYSHVEHIKLLQSYYPQNPSLHFYEYLYSIQSNEFTTSYEAFYRYFDYSMIQERRRIAENVTASTSSTALQKTGTIGVSGISSILQYAPIELAALHAEFGYLESARMATQEAIRVAQQYHDGACIAYAMGCMPLQRASLTSEIIMEYKDSLRRCIKRGVFNRLYNLASGAALTLAQQEATTTFIDDEGFAQMSTSCVAIADGGLTKHLQSIWKEVLSASTMTFNVLALDTMRHQGATVDFSSYALSTSMPINVPFIDTYSVLAEQNLVSSAVWEVYGNQAMSFLMSKISINVYGDVLLRMKHTLAKHKCIVGGLLGHRSIFDSNALSKQSNCTQAACQKASENIYFKSFLDLLSLQKLHPPSYGTSLHAVICFPTALLLHDWFLSIGKIYDALSLGVFLNSVSDGGSKVYGGVIAFLQVTMRSTLTLCYFHRWEEARGATRHMIALAARRPLSYIGYKLIFQLCGVMLATDSTHPARVFPLLTECLSLSQRLSYDSLHAAAICLLAKVFLSMGYWRKSMPLIRGSLPFVLAHAPMDVQGELWLVFAKCILIKVFELNTQSKAFDKSKDRLHISDARKVVKMLSTSLLHTNEALVLFRKIQSTRFLKEAFYLKARLCNDLYRLTSSEVAARKDYLQERNSASRSFRKICRHEATSACLPKGSYDLRRCLSDINQMESLGYSF